jgi:hypothetical protein
VQPLQVHGPGHLGLRQRPKQGKPAPRPRPPSANPNVRMTDLLTFYPRPSHASIAAD